MFFPVVESLVDVCGWEYKPTSDPNNNNKNNNNNNSNNNTLTINNNEDNSNNNNHSETRKRKRDDETGQSLLDILGRLHFILSENVGGNLDL